MLFAKTRYILLAAMAVLPAAAATAQETKPADVNSSSVTILAQSTPGSILASLDSRVFGATSDVREFSPDNLIDLTGATSGIYLEYGVTSAASREYTGIRAEVFEARNQVGAFGLFAFFAGRAGAVIKDVDAGTARAEGELLFWKGKYFVRLVDTARKRSGRRTFSEALARGISDGIAPANTRVAHPPLLDSLPKSSLVEGSQRYFLGPEALSDEVEHAREMFPFEGDTEAVAARYAQNSGALDAKKTSVPANRDASPAGDSSLELVICEYHTPQFATDAMARVTGYVESLPESEQQGIVIRRSGNYIAAAFGVRDRGFADALVNSVEYPYTVKWLRNPLWPANDPFRAQKAAQMLLSTFGLLGLILLTVLAGGTLFGTTIFLKRRKRQREVFSDAGGMLRLELDPFESVMLGLPPKRSDE